MIAPSLARDSSAQDDDAACGADRVGVLGLDLRDDYQIDGMPVRESSSARAVENAARPRAMLLPAATPEVAGAVGDAA
jgi:hypothetical protein